MAKIARDLEAKFVRYKGIILFWSYLFITFVLFQGSAAKKKRIVHDAVRYHIYLTNFNNWRIFLLFVKDFVDYGYGYDTSDSFVDDSEAVSSPYQALLSEPFIRDLCLQPPR